MCLTGTPKAHQLHFFLEAWGSFSFVFKFTIWLHLCFDLPDPIVWLDFNFKKLIIWV